MTTFTYVGTHADVLGGGRPVAPGEQIDNLDLEDADNAHRIGAGLLVENPTPPPASSKSGGKE